MTVSIAEPPAVARSSPPHETIAWPPQRPTIAAPRPADVFGPEPGVDEVAAVLQSRLDALPGHADEIAVFLQSLHVTGRVRSAHRCALGRYLGANLSARYLVRVDDHEARLLTGGRAGTTRHHLPLPAAVITFLRRFDNGDYPALIAPRP